MHVHACGHATGPDLVPQPSVLVVPAQLQLLLLPRVLISSLAAALLATQVPSFPIPLQPVPELLICLFFLLVSTWPEPQFGTTTLPNCLCPFHLGQPTTDHPPTVHTQCSPSSSSSAVMDLERRVSVVLGALLGGGGAAKKREALALLSSSRRRGVARCKCHLRSTAWISSYSLEDESHCAKILFRLRLDANFFMA